MMRLPQYSPGGGPAVPGLRPRAGAELAEPAGEDHRAVRAGGAADTLGRLIAEQLTIAFHQQFYVENRGGAGGIIGAAAGAAAEPDGYTLVVSSIASNVISPVFNANVGYDGMRDFTHIAYLGGPPAVMIVHPSLGVKTYKDFVASRAPARSR